MKTNTNIVHNINKIKRKRSFMRGDRAREKKIIIRKGDNKRS